MSDSNMESVIKAAKFLDEHVGQFGWLTKDWRSKIDVSQLRMLSTRRCVLGQLSGNYVQGDSDLSVAPGWSAVESAFGGCQQEWVTYLSRIDEKAKWRNKNSGKPVKEVVNVTIGGEQYVAFVDYYNDTQMLSIGDFRARYELIPAVKYVKWDILADQNGVFFVVEGDMRIINLSTLTHQSQAYWESEGHVFTLRLDKTGSSLWRSLRTGSV